MQRMKTSDETNPVCPLGVRVRELSRYFYEGGDKGGDVNVNVTDGLRCLGRGGNPSMHPSIYTYRQVYHIPKKKAKKKNHQINAQGLYKIR